ncbi:hypothetical protein BDW74DRAFT_168449 [Aspergillus multicolor]|uniref:uncharacterized protein n=1 Tax=Aspergillus multicolor TaxID=41759 RepID=UPI003CCDCBF4
MFTQWLYRCLPGFSIITLFVLLLLSSREAFPGTWRGLTRDKHRDPELSLAKKVFIVYTVLVHLNTLLFTGRLSWSLSYAYAQTSKLLKRRAGHSPSGTLNPMSSVDDTFLSALDTKSTQVSLTKVLGEVVHAIILPNYYEDFGTLRETLDVLARHQWARSQYEVYLAMEQREVRAAEKAEKLALLYGQSFALIQATFHPDGLPLEVAGKNSNVAFAARRIRQIHLAELESGSCNVIITVMVCTSNQVLYSCPIIFDRNSSDSPILVRCADLIWSFADLSTMCPSSKVSIPTSVYSLPLTLASAVGGWDSDPTSIGEDLHMMLKCYFSTHGNLVSRVIHAPASQCNVSSHITRPGLSRNLHTCAARYRQALRYMWGALDSGYAARNTMRLTQFSRRCRLLGSRHLSLMHLLWEAHFLPCHFTILLTFSMMYEQAALYTSTPLHPAITFTFTFTVWIRTLSFIGMNVCISLYNRWYKLCFDTRKQDSLLGNSNVGRWSEPAFGGGNSGFSDRAPWYRLTFLLERVAFPIAGIVFGAVPAGHAVFMHLWTDRLAYHISKKPTLGTVAV